MQGCKMSIVERLISDLIASYTKNSKYAEKFIMTWINTEVYKYDYSEIGRLHAELLPVTENMSVSINEQYDGANALEDFTSRVLENMFRAKKIIVSVQNSNKINISRLVTLKNTLLIEAPKDNMSLDEL